MIRRDQWGPWEFRGSFPWFDGGRRGGIPAGLMTLFAFAAPLAGQSTVPEELRARLDSIGFSPPSAPSLELYTPLLRAAPTGGVQVTRDLPYGPHERNLLDVYDPGDLSGAPVLIYVHGGGYVGGNKDVSDEVYGNVATWFARNGVLGVNATYRLAPEGTWPSGIEDVRSMVAWVRAHAAEFGGDPDRVFLMGHSAGATHVAGYAFDSRFHPPEGHGVAGMILVSGRYQVRADPDDPTLGSVRQYFGDDATRYPSRSPLSHVPDSEVPALLVLAEYDQRNLVETSGELFVALCLRDGGRCPRIVQLRYHNHLSEVYHINTADELLGREALDFIREGADRQRERARVR